VEPKRILVVDDHPGIVATLRVAFRVDGDRFRMAGAAGTAADGLARVAEESNDAVVLDLQLPDAGGAELVRAFHAVPGVPPLIVHTAGADMHDLGAARDLAEAVVTKGDLDALLTALARATGLR
jgi:two-component system KDP operon response regulator KdpE